MDYSGLGIIGSVLAGLSGLYYIWTILKGQTKPQRVTWFGWSLATILGAWTALSSGAGKGGLVVATFAVMLTTIFVLSLFPKYGKPGGRQLDYVLAASALAVIVLWQAGNFSPSVAASLAVVADFGFAWPTVREAWRQPKTEALLPWILGTLAGALGVAGLQSFNYPAAAFPIYLTVINCVIVGVLAGRK